MWPISYDQTIWYGLYHMAHIIWHISNAPNTALSRLPLVEFRPNDHGNDALHFIFSFQISEEEISALASKWNLEYIETSAKTKMNVDKIFYDLMKKIHEQKKTTAAKQIPTKQIKNRSLKKSLSTFWKYLQGNCRKWLVDYLWPINDDSCCVSM